MPKNNEPSNEAKRIDFYTRMTLKFQEAIMKTMGEMGDEGELIDAGLAIVAQSAGTALAGAILEMTRNPDGPDEKLTPEEEVTLHRLATDHFAKAYAARMDQHQEAVPPSTH